MRGPKTRVALFDAYPHLYGGGQRMGHLLAARLPARGWEVVTVTPARGTLVEQLEADGLPVEVVPAPRALRAYGRTTTGSRLVAAILALPVQWLRLWRSLRALRPAVVHVVDHRGLVLAGLPARLVGARVVWHVHAAESSRLLNAVGARLSHVTLVPTAGALDALPGIPAGRVRVVGNALPDSKRPEVLPPLGDDPVIVTVGRLHPDKAVDVLLDAFALVRARVPDARLCVVGGEQLGFEEIPDELRRRARDLGVDAAVDLLGTTEDPAETVSAARCYVQASRHETFGLAILEAMALGIPVVATAVGGVPGLVRNDVSGLLVPPDDPEAMAAAIGRVLQDRRLADTIRTAAWRHATGPEFTVDRYVDSVVAAYGSGER